LKEERLEVPSFDWSLGSDDSLVVEANTRQSLLPMPIPSDRPTFDIETLETPTASKEPWDSQPADLAPQEPVRREVTSGSEGQPEIITHTSVRDPGDLASDTFLTNLPGAGQLNPDRFYDDDYLPTLREYVCALVDSQGPMTFLLLSELVARAHGWKRTGSIIKKRVWAAISPVRRHTKGGDTRTVLWPESTAPQQYVPFRGTVVNGYLE
jgi:hypothetical protein